MRRQVAYSLSPPRLTSKTVPRQVRQRESFRDFGLNEDGGALVALVGVLLVDSGVMFLWVVAALQDGAEELAKLTESVARVVDM